MKITRYFFILLFAVCLTSASAQSVSIGGIINHYAEVVSFDSCKNAMVVLNAEAFNPGDTVVIMQMKGAVIDSSNTATFGEIADYRGAGNYEFNYVAKKIGNQIFFKNKLLATYNIPDGIVQLIRVPYYKADVNVNAILTAANWDGGKGGVLVLNVAGNISLNANVDVTDKGFRGGMAINRKTNVLSCDVTIYAGPSSARAAQKGESIASLSEKINYGRGAPASAGGGGLDHNSGGGGGGNGGAGGFGGYQYYYCTRGIFENRGLGGRSMPYGNLQKVFMGGGGGAGDCNNDPGMNSNGGNGGGIAMIIGRRLQTNTHEIVATGGNAPECALNAQQNNCHDGMGGGGAGGSILLSITEYTDQASLNITGGKGADMRGVEAGQLGPGGGGGGGVVWFNEQFQPSNAVVTQSGGGAGVNVYHNNDAWGATDGDPGRNFYSLELPFSNTPYTPNIESIGFNQSTASCTGFVFDGFAQTNLSGITRWSWDFGDGTQQAGQRVTHNYVAGGEFLVSLIAEDASGCKDSASATVKPGTLEATAGTDTAVCANTPFNLVGSGGANYAWSPGTLLNDSTSVNPTGSIQTTTTFRLIASDGLCRDTASVVVSIRDPQSIVAPADVLGCEGSIVSLNGNNGNNVLYEWSPATLVSNPNVAEPTVTASSNTTFTVKITEKTCNTSQLFPVQLTVSPKPDLQVHKSNDIDCTHATARLMATGANQYIWTPAANLDDASIPNPVASINATTQFTVTGTTLAGCSATDTITVVKSAGGNANFSMPNAFTPNNDGKNDCFGVGRFGDITLEEFSVYNRWGQKVFTTKNPSECWNGFSQGRPLETGGYGYKIKGKSSCGIIDFKGIVMLIR